MTNRRLWLFLAILSLLATPVVAQGESGSVDGSLSIGYRDVSIGGTETKYKEDLNYDSGPRLFELHFDFVPEAELRGAVDRVILNIANFGGDPYETLSLSIQKSGRYDFRYDRRKSDYFYSDIILPVELSGDPANALAGDFHHFDFTRVRDDASLDIWMNKNAKFVLDFSRFTKIGESTTTLDLQRDEFELDKPIDESSNQISGAFEYKWDKATLILQETYTDYENLYEIFLPGQSQGEDPTDSSVVDFFFLDQPYDYTSLRHQVTLTARPNPRFLMTFQGALENLGMDLKAEESSGGTGFSGAPFTTAEEGDGSIDRDLELFDIDLSYLLNDTWALVGGLRQYSLDQSGDFMFGAEDNIGRYKIDTTTFEAGIQYAPTSQFSITVGLRDESRDVDTTISLDGELDSESHTTDQTGYYAVVGWRPSKMFRLDLDVEDSSFDDPYTLSSPTDRQRYRLQAKVNLENGFWGSALYQIQDIKNTNSDWNYDYDQLNLRIGYRVDAFDFALGWSNVNYQRDIVQMAMTAPGFGGDVPFDFPVFYESDSDFIDGRIRWIGNERVTLGGDFRLYDNSGSFALARDDYRLYADIGVCKTYVLHLGYRMIDYDEDASNFDDYDADIIEVGVGYTW